MNGSQPVLSDHLRYMNGSNETTEECIVDTNGHEFEWISDPRVNLELEDLKTSTQLITKLDVELNESRNHFHVMLSESSNKISDLAKKLGNCVDKVKPYYEAKVRAKDLKSDVERAVIRYDKSITSLAMAKEMVKLAEESLQKENNVMNTSWQQMLNHSTIKVNQWERQRTLEQTNHQRISQDYNNAQQLALQLHKQLKHSINKTSLESRRHLLQLNNITNQHELQLLPYFEMKGQFNQMMDDQISKMRSLEERVSKAKLNYSKALQRLEEINNEMNQRRKVDNLLLHEDRGIGAGAESSDAVSPKLRKSFRKLSLETEDLSQMLTLKSEWFTKRNAKSETNSDRDDTESMTTTDTLDDTVIDNTMIVDRVSDTDKP
ncbi:SH3 domain-binding protein 5-like isoform X1 [Oppia nitens]|uniref:SH3 domain-binding protein 5-like isoform X1 n=1 Tax=Oppia nitens TaxID=1686743 RepID=UPI0023DA6BC7|nr:SH3 domain-binding protein 5-like isoform X1 [Oppia nitens]